MQLARVIGQCTATVKDPTLDGRRLALVRRTDAEGAIVGEVEVALDVTGAAPGALVVVTRGSAARQPADNRQLAADLSVIAIVDDLTQEFPGKRTSRSSTNKKAAPRPRTGGKSNG